MTKENRLTLKNEVGLHARPASIFVKKASDFSSKISVRNLTWNSEWANAKSILSILTLGAEQGHQIGIRATGGDEVVQPGRSNLERHPKHVDGMK